MIFNCIRNIVRFFMIAFYRIHVEGFANFPASGAIVICANHTFVKDLFVIGCASPRKIYWMAKAELFQIPLFGSLIRRLGAFPVNRGSGDRDSIRTVYGILNAGEPLGIFPEGTRILDPYNRPPYKRGFVSFAVNSGASILPVALRYEDGPFGRGKMFSRVVISYGKAVEVDRDHKYSRSEIDDITVSVSAWINENIQPPLRHSERSAES